MTRFGLRSNTNATIATASLIQKQRKSNTTAETISTSAQKRARATASLTKGKSPSKSKENRRQSLTSSARKSIAAPLVSIPDASSGGSSLSRVLFGPSTPAVKAKAPPIVSTPVIWSVAVEEPPMKTEPISWRRLSLDANTPSLASSGLRSRRSSLRSGTPYQPLFDPDSED